MIEIIIDRIVVMMFACLLSDYDITTWTYLIKKTKKNDKQSNTKVAIYVIVIIVILLQSVTLKFAQIISSGSGAGSLFTKAFSPVFEDS